MLICLWVGNRHFAPDVSLQRIYLILFAAAAQPPRRVLAFAAAVPEPVLAR